MRRLATLVLFALAWIGLGLVEPVAMGRGAGLPLMTVAFALLAGLALGEGLARIGLPRLSGYLAVGVVMGPVAGSFDPDLHATLRLVELDALALLALQAGYLLDLRRARAALVPALAVTLTTSVAVLALSVAAVLAFAALLPPLHAGDLALALAAAALMVGASPAVIGAVVGESRAAGPVTDLALAVAALSSLAALGAVALAATLGLDPTAAPVAALAETLLPTGHATLLVLVAGALVAAAFRWLRRAVALPLAVLVLAIVADGAAAGETLVLPLLLLGVGLRNTLPDEGSEGLSAAVSDLAALGTLVFFTLVGARLPLPTDLGLALAALALAGARAVGLLVGTRLGARWTGQPRALRRAGAALWPQGGLTLGLLAVVAPSLPADADVLISLVGSVVAFGLLAGPVALKVALRTAEELPADLMAAGDALSGRARFRPVTLDAIALPQEARPDPLAGLQPPADSDLARPWTRTAEGLVQLRDQLRDHAISDRLTHIAGALAAASRQARHSLQVAAEACGRCATPDAMRAVVLEQREHLAGLLRAELQALEPPARAEEARSVVRLVDDGIDAIVREAAAELLLPEGPQHLAARPGDPTWVRAGKLAKRQVRRVQRFFGRPSRLRAVPYRRIVRRVVAGELVARLSALEGLVGRAEFKAVRRAETLLRSADDAFLEALVRVDDGAEPEAMREWLGGQLQRLRDASRDARDDMERLAGEPLHRFAEEAALALGRVTELADRAGTFALGEADLRFATVAPRVRAAVAEAERERARWGAWQAALRDRATLWIQLVEIHGRLRTAALQDAMGPAQRMHARIRELLRDAMEAVALAREDLLDRVRAGVPEAAGAEAATPGDVEVLRKLVDDLTRRVVRPVEGILEALRSSAMVDRLLGALETVTGELPDRLALLGEPAIAALARGRPTDARPVAVPVREVARTFFDRRVAVRLAEQMRALETSADEVLVGLRDALRLLALQLSQEEVDDGAPAAPAAPEPEAEADPFGAERRMIATIEAAGERISTEVAQAAETAEGLVREVDAAEASAVQELWRRLMKEAERTPTEDALAGVRRWLETRTPTLADDPRWVRLRDGWHELVHELRARRRAVEARADATLGGPERVRRALAALDPDARPLPYVYGKLFSLDPTENDAFIVDREREIGLVGDRFASNAGGALVLVGARGSGRTSVVRVAAARTRLKRAVAWLEVERGPGDPAALYRAIARALGAAEGEASAEAVATLLRKRAPILVLDGVERLLERSAAGLAVLDALGALIAATRVQTLWVATAEEHAWELLGELGALTDVFDTVVRLRGLGPEALRLAIERRHRLSELELAYRLPPRLSLRRLAWRLSRADAATRYHRRLAEVSRGNPRTGLQLWRLSLHGVDGHHFEVAPCPDPSPLELAELPAHLAPALYLAVHDGALDPRHLERALGCSRAEGKALVAALVAAGLLAGRLRADGEMSWSVPPAALAPASAWLARQGLGPARARRAS